MAEDEPDRGLHVMLHRYQIAGVARSGPGR
jgi:hypothetical protein